MDITFDRECGQYGIKRKKSKMHILYNGVLSKNQNTKIWGFRTCYGAPFTRKELEKIVDFMRGLEKKK